MTERARRKEAQICYYTLSLLLSPAAADKCGRNTESHRRKEWLTFFVFHAAAPCNLIRFSRRHTVVRLATEQDVTVGRGSTPHTTAKVTYNIKI